MERFAYEDFEKEFLEAMATRFGINGKNRIIFEERFREKNARETNAAIATYYYEELIEGTKNGDAVRIFNQQLSAINQKLEKAGCVFSNGYKWEDGKKWLRSEMFPQWLREERELASLSSLAPTLSQLWEQMKSGAKRDKMGAVFPEGPAVLGARRKQPSGYLKEVPKDSDILFKVELERSGHLILLEREPNGVVCCLCPSEYAPKSLLSAGELVFPQLPASPYETFGADGEGWEQWLAIASVESPPLAWLEESRKEALELSSDRLQELWEYVRGTPDCLLMYAEYKVTA